MSKEKILMGVMAVFVCAGAGVCFGDVITVNWDGSGDYTTIQAAIDVAVSGVDTIIVEDGTYIENISFGGKNITLTSTAPDDWAVVEATVIDGGGNGCVVTFGGSESAECVLTGFTITGGYDTLYGGAGVLGNGTGATINKCIVTDNETTLVGGGIRYCNGTISHCKIIGNTTEVFGGGIAGSHGRIDNCLIANNSADRVGGINNCDGDIVNCTIVSNTANSEGVVRDCDGAITNCIVWGK